jgi:hypothetical protein
MSGLFKFIWTTYSITGTIGGPALTSGQQSTGASSEDNPGYYMETGH